ncbi:molybdopterin-dependent oxidoreductase [Pandoraea nosoerga]|nr:molybdopterin-dependent oxidoreductase [Pandoraea nosoerga]MBN4667094.1 molybdopterin-dependent oxidoreductase [Pandoraea nosoerga]MBN4677083.1 molybdopterin-dependent oxidoreductase [Pandoraea nosoerga]MBN4681881.1 molybdopterin-dependent oxidoreductase [Pandoraea nosoerga]MBN4746199.1 molybdopterin-dependent oxidoreductase [Pandoraea nosoerga]
MSLDRPRAHAGFSLDSPRSPAPCDAPRIAAGNTPRALPCAAAPASPCSPASSRPARVSREVIVSGCVKRRHSFDLCALMRLPTQLTGPLEVVCLSGRKVRGAGDYKGVRLTALLDLAQWRLPQARDFTRAYVLAHGADGYAVMFSWHELYNTPVGVGALVVYERDGQPLGDEEGGIGLISTCDLRVALRQVRALERLTVHLADAHAR